MKISRRALLGTAAEKSGRADRLSAAGLVALCCGMHIDELRALDWVPRSVRSKLREIEQAQRALEHELGRSPEDDEIAAGASAVAPAAWTG